MTRTPSQTVGPFFAIGLSRRPQQQLAADGVELSGRLLDGQAEPIADGVIELLDPASGRWGRSPTDPEGRYRFRVPRHADRLEAYVFARGLLRHQHTRIYLRNPADAEDPTLVAQPDNGGFRLDIRMQGDNATAFFQH